MKDIDGVEQIHHSDESHSGDAESATNALFERIGKYYACYLKLN